MTLREKIQCMEAFERGEEIEISNSLGETWIQEPRPNWNWVKCTYRIKPKPKQTVTIEKWLAELAFGGYIIIEGTRKYIQDFSNTKVKLLDTYEVEL